MTVCLDANVLVRCFTPEEGHDRALAWLRTKAGEGLVGPAFLPYEFASALLRKVQVGEMTMAQCAEALALFSRLEVRYVWDDSVLEAAFNLSLSLRQPTVYDTGYLAVAESERCELWTFDRKFASVASKDHPLVRLLE